MFERNTITTAMSIAMTRRDKEQAIRALVESVDEISEPLEEYIISRKSDLREFSDVSIDDGNTRTTFDILMGSSHVLNGGGDDDKSKSNNLRRVLEDYGAIIIKIVDGYVETRHVESFVESLAKYASLSKTQIGLGLIIGEEISPEARESVNKLFFEKKTKQLPINYLLLIDKPSYPPTTQQTPPAAFHPSD
jgi:hypothetical protein